MTLDDVYGPDQDEFPLEQEAEDWDEETLGLDWEESEARRICDEIAPLRGA
ncbi:MAG TPA: hypothetical protein VFB93_05920 [Burkholderiales bacterium]|nr:hypothetical protein [Burkholderiales bacterium]